MYVAVLILTAFLAMSFLAAGVPLIAGVPKTFEQASHLRISHDLLKIAGGLQVAGAVGVIAGVWLAPLGIAAGLALALLMICAGGTHMRVRDPLTAAVPAAVLAVVAVAYALCRYLSA